MQDEKFEKIHSKSNLLRNKITQIQKEASRLSEKQSQVEEVNSVIITDKKEVSTAEEQTKITPYRHPQL